ncbi:MAG: bifunctional riboflavin kinase/FAD synthetase [Cyclobacteriaceae bacterium]|nr:bifunctional riboflavin kinase/FAD synthetase [Cyclobacteriaceae bacterium]
MRIYEGFKDFKKIKNAVVTSGTFDGVHIGHQTILNRLKQISEREKGEIVLITFWPHPRLVLFPNENLQLINTFEEKAALLESYGVDHLIKIPFTKEFAGMSSSDFVQTILVEHIQTHILVIGYDHRFGRNREGSFEYLKENEAKFGFKVEEIPRQEVDAIGVSSTRIREALMAGDVAMARSFMGHNFELSGQVVHGDKIGKQLGFPTANILVNSPNKIIPADGVYAVTLELNSKLMKGMLYIGKRPTLNGTQRKIEVNIFDFNEDIYSKDIKISFIEQTRGDMKFNSLEELSEKLSQDKLETEKILSEYGRKH